jgi:hypothetical protein
MTLMDFTNSSFDSFFAPSCSEYFFVFLLRVHCIAPKRSTFQGVLRSVDFILVKDFANSIDILLVWQSFLFWNHFSYFKDYVYSKSSLLKWKQRCPFLKRPFANQAFWSKTQHTFFQNIQSFDCHVFWKQKLTRCKTKMAFFFSFFMVHCIHFRLWFWAYLLMVCDEVTFCELQETKGSSQNLRIHQERWFSFLAPILSACIITSSLIHEATTLMEKLFKFWERHLSVQIAYLIKKGF